MRTRLPAVLAAVVAVGLAAAPAVAAEQRITVGAVQSSSGTVSMIAAVDPLPVPALGPDAVSASSGGSPLSVQSGPILPGMATVGFVVDASADGGAALDDDGRSGAAGFLLQLPPSTTAVVVADRRPATVIAGPVTGVAAGLTAVSGLRSTGARDTSAALGLAVGRLPAWPSAQPVVVLYTGAADAGGETAAALTARLLRAHAVLAVVTTADDAYWSQVAGATGGLAVRTTPARAISAFDQVADGLKARYALSVARPATGGPIDLRVGSATATVTPPAARDDEPRALGGRDDESSGPGQYVGPAVIVLLVLGLLVLVVALVVIRPRRPKAAPATEPGPPETPAPTGTEVAPGVRVYEGADLFEPRAVRDARTAARRAAAQPPPPRVGEHNGIPVQGRTAREVAESGLTGRGDGELNGELNGKLNGKEGGGDDDGDDEGPDKRFFDIPRGPHRPPKP